MLLLTEIKTSAQAGCATTESEKKSALAKVEVLSFSSGDIGQVSYFCDKPENLLLVCGFGYDLTRAPRPWL